MTKLVNLYETVLAGAARIREIKEVRNAESERGTYQLNQYKKVATPVAIAENEMLTGVVGRDYFLRAVSKSSNRTKEYNKSKRR